MGRLLAAAAAALAILCVSAFGQTSNASVGGFVQDPSGAFVPGATVKATNTQTGVVNSAVTNESGTYNIPSLLPGAYRLTAELPGFKTAAVNNVQLGASTAARYNFTLEVGAVSQAVEVTASTTALLAESSPTIGQVLTEQKVRDLPLVTNNVLDLMKTMPGVRGGIYSSTTTFAGISASAVNTTRDGLSVQEGRYAYGVGSTTLINPDMVGELRVILAPVDAETGRGNGQVQITTRSGTNQYHGSAVWNVRNSALDANTWSNNKQVVRGVWTPSKGNWQNEHEYSVSLGGPIKKNKTFFFFLWDQQFERDRTQMRPVVLTDCARNGVFRYWQGYQNGNINQIAANLGTTNPIRQSVDSFGNPLPPETNPNGTPYTGQLRYFSVFGPLLNTPTQPDCSDAVVDGGNPWDTNRRGMDPAGFSQRYLQYMPHPNRFDGGDGLNTAIHQWEFAGHGTGDLNTAYGTSFIADHYQANLKIDHVINPSHKIAFNGSFQVVPNDYIPVSGPTVQWPGGYLSETLRKPRVFTVNLTSTLGAGILNEARFGYRANWHYVWAPWEVPNEADREVPLSFMLNGSNGVPIVYNPATIAATGTGGGTLTTVSFTCATGCAQQGNYTPLYQYADTLTWSKGKHTYKAGVDIRIGFTKGYETPTAPIPKALGGAGQNPNQRFSNNAAMPGLVANNQTVANSLLYFLSGSLNQAQQYYHIYDSHDPQWNSFLDHTRKLTWAHQNDWSVFFKDDWKIRPSLTLNLGARLYEFYGAPYEHNGLTPTPVGGGIAMLGVSGRSFDQWLKPNVPIDMNNLMQIELVGPNSPNPGHGLYKNDWNNIGPAVGFSWQLPWLGKEMTNVRGGYQITYAKPANLAALVNGIFLNPGFSNLAQSTGPLNGDYFDLRNLRDFVPIIPATAPLQPIPLTKPNQAISAFDYNFTTPYIQNLTMSVTRKITSFLNLDVRYIGTRGLKLDGNWDLNVPNVFYNDKLFDALERTRRGEDVELFDQMFLGLNLNPGVAGCDPANPSATCAPVNGTTQRGSQHLRTSSTFRSDLANGTYAALSNALNVFNGVGSGPAGTVNFGVAGERGTVLKRANAGFNIPGGNTGGAIPAGSVVPAGLFPANWITANPQVSAANYYTNTGKSNYNSVQFESTLRAGRTLTFQGSYVWSKSMALSAGTYTNPADRDKDYNLAPSHVTHDFRANGTFSLPFGPNRQLFSNASGWVARLVEDWQSSVIINANTGQPASVVGSTTLYSNGVPDIVGDFPVKPFSQSVWNGDFGQYFGSSFGQVADPQCAQIASVLRPYCTLQAVTDSKTNQIVLQNAQPGRPGTLGQKTMELPGAWAFDVAMSKAFRISESKSMQVRLDSTNIFNHPLLGTPTLNINSTTPFGNISDKGNQRRQFKAQVRLNF